MAVLSNNGRLISSLPVTSTIGGSDEFLLQTGGVTKRTTFSNIKSSVLLDFLNPFSGIVKFTNINNKISGSFYGNVTGDLTGNVTGGLNKTITAGDGLSGGGTLSSNISIAVNSTVVRTSGTQTIGGSKTFSSTILGNITSTGTSTFSSIDVNGGAVDGTTIGSISPSSVVGTTITANSGFVGNLTGDVYNANSNKVLENGSGTPTTNGGIPNAYFYGTSSYATQALTAAYAASSTPASNGLPSGGSQYQVLNKLSGTNYDAGWVTPITRSGVPTINYLSYWVDNKTLGGSNLSYNSSSNRLSITNGGINISTGNIVMASGTGTITGSIKGYQINRSIESPDELYALIEGHKYSTAFLELSASGYCTMSLMSGQTSTVFVQNSGNYKIYKWSGSLDGGNSANTKIYWKNAQSASITQGDQKKDVITFVNINNKIFGTFVNDFQ